MKIKIRKLSTYQGRQKQKSRSKKYKRKLKKYSVVEKVKRELVFEEMMKRKSKIEDDEEREMEKALENKTKRPRTNSVLGVR